MTTVTISNNTGATYSGVGSSSLLEVVSTTPNVYPSVINVQSSSGDRRHGLVIFSGLSNIPTGATVTAASLSMNVVSGVGASKQYDLLKLLTASVAGQESWINASSVPVAWSSPGAFNATDANLTAVDSVFSDASLTTGYSVTSYSAGLLALVQSWVTTPSSNNGLLIVRNPDTVYDGSYINFISPVDTTLGPVLTVTYSVGGSFPSASSKRFTSQRHSFGLRS